MNDNNNENRRPRENERERREERGRENEPRRSGEGWNRTTFEKRKKQSDWVINTASVLSFLAWLATIAVWFFVDKASPDQHGFAHGLTDHDYYNLRTTWNTTLLWSGLGFLIASLGLCVLAFMFNMTRMKRKTDKYRKSIIIIGIINVIALVAYILVYGQYFLWT